MYRYKLNVSYLGTNFNGWQKINIPEVISVQGVIQDCLNAVTNNTDIQVYGSGRTDSGVHASSQVCNVTLIRQRKDPHKKNVQPNGVTTTPIASKETLFASWDRFCNDQHKSWRKKRQEQDRVNRMKHTQVLTKSSRTLLDTRYDDASVLLDNIQPDSEAPPPSHLLPTLIAVRKLPSKPPKILIAASAAIDVVKRDRRHKYDYNYARACIVGIRGLRSIHCDLGICRHINGVTPLEQNTQPCYTNNNDKDVLHCNCRIYDDEVLASINANSLVFTERSKLNTIEDSHLTTTLSPFQLTKYAEIVKDYMKSKTTVFLDDIPVQIPLLLAPMPPHLLTRSVNDILRKKNIPARINSAEFAEPSFEARFDAFRRRYVYRVHISPVNDALEEGRSWIIRNDPNMFDMEKANYVAEALIGRHNFNSFRAVGCQAKSPIRGVDDIQIDWLPSYTEQLQGHPHVIASDPQIMKDYVTQCKKEQLLDFESSFLYNSTVMVFGNNDNNLVSKPKEKKEVEHTELTKNNPDMRTQVEVGYESINEDQIDIINNFLKRHDLALNKENKVVPISSILNSSNPEKKLISLEEIPRKGCVLTISVVARAFLHSQVRIMVGAIIDAGFNSYPHTEIHDIINRADRLTNPAKTAPACGLYLTSAEYPSNDEYSSWKDLQFAQVKVAKKNDFISE